MYREGEIFTFLMPAAKGIYEPYDFRTVFEQTRPYVKDLEGWIQAGGKDCQELSEWANDSLKKSCPGLCCPGRRLLSQDAAGI